MHKLTPPRELNFSAVSLSEEWRRWEKSFTNYYAAAELREKSRATQVAILLNCAGEEARDIFDSFNVEVTADATTCDVVLQLFRTYCNPKKRPAFESFKFWQRQQAEGEPFDKWLMELRVIGRNCEFGDTFNRQLRDKILFGTRDDVARQRMLEEEDLTLEKAINICHTLESTNAQLHFMAEKDKRENIFVNEIKQKHGKHSVMVHSDHKPLEYIWKKPLSKTPPRLQRLMLRLQPYDLIIRYVPGKYMYMADTLSRAHLPTVSGSEIDDDLVQVVHSLVTNLPVTTTSLDKIKRATAADGILQKVRDFCLSGWPRSIKNVPQSVRSFWHKRDVLHVADDILFADQRIVVPSLLQPQMLTLLHESHFGIEKTKSRARELLYWPNMCADIERIVSQCELCVKYQNNHPREPLISHDIPNERFLKVAMDIMTFRNQEYLVIVDYFSKYPEMIALANKTASAIVLQCKNVFARHGIPTEIVSDNMPFNSHEFLTFTKEWGILLTTSSPTYSQSNGQAERFVQTLKRMLQKATDLGKDPYLALLEYRNTPVTGMKYSPAQILFSRCLRTKIPVATSLLSPVVVDPSFDLIRNQARQKYYYDRQGVKPLSSLQRGDVVCYRKNNVWQKSDVVKDCNKPRSYMIRRPNDCGVLRRNRRHLYKANLKRPEYNRPFCNYSRASQQVSSTATPVYNASPLDSTLPDPSSGSSVSTSRYGRPIKFPSKYSDFVV